MSRLRRLKERKRKDIIKVASCGLALALAIGSAQGLGTYALFTDTEDVSSDLSISTGDVDVEVSGGFKFENLYPSETRTHTFIITNYGTLRQHIKLNLKDLIPQIEITLTSEQKEALEYLKNNFKYSIDFGINSEVAEIPDNEVGGNIKDISNINLSEEVVLRDEGSQIFTLEPGQQITANISIYIPDLVHEELNIQDLLFNIGPIKVDLHVEARQISSNNSEVANYGFFDLQIQQNTISISEYEENIISGGAIKVAPDNTIHLSTVGHGQFHGLNSIIPDMDKIINGETCIGSGTGVFKNEALGLILGNQWYYLSPVDTASINNSFGGDKISIKLYYDLNGDKKADEYKIYELSFRKVGIAANGNRLLEAIVTFVDKGAMLTEQETEVSIKPEVVEPPKEEVEVPTEPEVVEPPKEEVEVPSEPEVVEPPKEEVEKPIEPEVVEPPKKEVEVPSEPEVVEPPKENEGIQE